MDRRSLHPECPVIDLLKLPTYGQPLPGFSQDGHETVHRVGALQHPNDTHSLHPAGRHEACRLVDECDLGDHACVHDDLVPLGSKRSRSARLTTSNGLELSSRVGHRFRRNDCHRWHCSRAHEPDGLYVYYWL